MEPKYLKNVENILKTLLENSTRLDNSQISLDLLMDEILKFSKQTKYEKENSLLTIENIEKIKTIRAGTLSVESLEVTDDAYIFNCNHPSYLKGVSIKLDRNENSDGKYPMTESNFKTTFYIEKNIIRNPKQLMYKMAELTEELPF